MSEKKSFFRSWLLVCWIPLLTLSAGIAMQALRITGQPQQYISLAKLIEEAPVTRSGSNTVEQYEIRTKFYGTVIETLESAEMRRRALDRVRALHPDLKKTEVDIQVSQIRGSAIINIRAFGSEPKYTRLFLDALLDEFMANWKKLQESAGNMVSNVKIMERASPPVEDLQDWTKPIISGALIGGVGGLVLSLLLALLIHSIRKPTSIPLEPAA